MVLPSGIDFNATRRNSVIASQLTNNDALLFVLGLVVTCGMACIQQTNPFKRSVARPIPHALVSLLLCALSQPYKFYCIRRDLNTGAQKRHHRPKLPVVTNGRNVCWSATQFSNCLFIHTHCSWNQWSLPQVFIGKQQPNIWVSILRQQSYLGLGMSMSYCDDNNCRFPTNYNNRYFRYVHLPKQRARSPIRLLGPQFPRFFIFA